VTSSMHWGTFKSFAGFLIREKKIEASNILLHDVLRKSFITDYFRWMGDTETVTMRGTTYDGKTIRLHTRGLSTVVQCVLVKRPLRKGEKKEHRRKKMATVLDHLKAVGSAEAKKRTAQGKTGGPSIRAMESKPEPLNLEQMKGGVWHHALKEERLRQKIAGLNMEQTPHENWLYMSYLAARLRAAWLCFHFVMLTLERNQCAYDLVLERNLLIRDDDITVFAPVGAQATKTEPQKRMSRGYFVSRKFLPASWTGVLRRYLAEDLPVLKEYFALPGGPVFDPAAEVTAEGHHEIALFQYFSKDNLRRAMDQVAKVKCNQIR
ncbi:unnamed protein product, partial [Effrenium voratum]